MAHDVTTLSKRISSTAASVTWHEKRLWNVERVQFYSHVFPVLDKHMIFLRLFVQYRPTQNQTKHRNENHRFRRHIHVKVLRNFT
jgi:hypothetical protein